MQATKIPESMMHWTQQIDQTTQAFVATFGKLTAEELNWKPNVETWSIAQNIHHLIVLNQSYFAIFSALKKGNYKTSFVAKLGFVVSFFGNMICNSVTPDRNKKIKTFAIWEPAASALPADIVPQFTTHQEQLKMEIDTIQPFVDKGTVIASPANKHIVYKLEKALDIIVVHEQRHLEQASEVYKLWQKTTNP